MSSMEVVVGTYEEVLIGLRLNKIGDVYNLTESFTDKSNVGSIRCVAISQQGILASGGTDEIIHILNLDTRKLVGTLTHHSGTITSLQFFKRSSLFSTSEDGTFCAWRMGNWESRTFKGHKGAVNFAAVHPSGKLALTVSQDKTLRTWNLVDGRPAFVSNIKEMASQVLWSADEKHYLVVVGNKIDIYSVEDGQVHRSITAKQKKICVAFATDNIIVYGGEGNIQKNAEREKAVLYFADITDGKELHQIGTESSRIRDLAICPSHENPDSEEKWLTSVGSDGTINVYRVNFSESVESSLIVSRNITLRLTCVAVSSPRPQNTVSDKQKSKKRKQEEVEVKEEPVSDSDNEADQSTVEIKTEPSDSDDSGEAKESDADEDFDEPKAKKTKKTLTPNGKQVFTGVKEKVKQKKKMKGSVSTSPQPGAGGRKHKGKKGNKMASKTSPKSSAIKSNKKVRNADPVAFDHKQRAKKGKQKIKKRF